MPTPENNQKVTTLWSQIGLKLRELALREKVFFVYVAVLAIFATLLFVNSGLYMGLDNYSPLFYPLESLRSLDLTGVVSKFPLLMLVGIFEILKVVGVSYIGISFLLKVGSFLSAGIGMYFLTRKLFKQIDWKSQTISIVSSLLYLFSMVGFWVFFEPNILFLIAFSLIPWGIFTFLTRGRSSVLLLVGFIILWSTVALNPLAYLLFTLQIILIGAVLARYLGESFKEVAVKLLPFVIGVIVVPVFSLLVVASINKYSITETVGGYFTYYTTKVVDNEIQSDVTESLRASESNSSVLESFGYINAWTKMQFPDSSKLFPAYEVYEGSVIKYLPVITLVVYLGWIFSLRKEKSTDQKGLKTVYVFLFLIIAGAIFSSRYFQLLFGEFNLLNDALRWPSSKFWPIVLIPMVLLLPLLSSMSNLVKYKVLAGLVVVSSFIFIVPAYLQINKTIEFAPRSIPQEYFDVKPELAGKTVVYLPVPQALYFRYYEFGNVGNYYGSDFVSYIWTETDVFDVANDLEDQEKYEKFGKEFCAINRELISKYGELKIYKSTIKGFDFVVWDGNSVKEVCERD